MNIMNIDFQAGYRSFAEKHTLEYSDYRHTQGSAAPQGVTNTKFCKVSGNDIVFFAFDKYSGSGVWSTTFSGFYCDIGCQLNIDCVISKRFPLLDLFKKRHSVGMKEIDQNLTFSTKNMAGIDKIIDRDITEWFLCLWKINGPVKLAINSEDNRIIFPLKEAASTLISIESQEWIIPEKMDESFELSERIFGRLKQNIEKIQKWGDL